MLLRGLRATGDRRVEPLYDKLDPNNRAVCPNLLDEVDEGFGDLGMIHICQRCH
jgi:hypothetical protein